MAFGKQAVVEMRDIDRYGRSVGWVTVAGKPVNLALVQQGMAWWYQKFAPRADDLRNAEAKARAAKLGLWADPEPQPPWQFRKDRKRCSRPAKPASRQLISNFHNHYNDQTFQGVHQN